MSIRSSFVRDVLTVLKGTAVAQLVGLAIMPVLARLFTPDAFGGYQIYMSAATVLLVGAALRYDVALLHARDEKELYAGLSVCVMLNILLSCAIFISSVAYVEFWPQTDARLEPIALWLGVALLVAGIAQTLSYAALWMKAYNSTAQARIAQSLGFSAAGLLAGTLLPTTSGLISADVGGRVAAAGMLVKSLRLRWRKFPESVRSGAARAFALEHRKYPSVGLPAGLLSAAASVLTPVFIYGVFDLVTAGQYAMVERCVMGPVGLLGQAVSQVFMSAFASRLRENREEAVKLLRTTIFNQFKLGLLPALGLAVAGPWIFTLIFGDAWAPAGEFARWMSPLVLLAFVTTPINMSFVLLGKQELQLLWDAGRLVAVIALWTLVGTHELSALAAIKWHVTISSLAYVIFVWAVMRETSLRT